MNHATTLAPILPLAIVLATGAGAQEWEPADFLVPPKLDLNFTLGFSHTEAFFVELSLGGRAMRLDAARDLREAELDEISSRLRSAPEDPLVHAELAAALWQRSRDVRHGSSLVDASEPEESRELRRRARSHELEAERLLRAALSTGRTEELELAYARSLGSLGRTLEARRLLERMTEADPPSWRAFLALVRHHARPFDWTIAQNQVFDPTVHGGDEQTHRWLARAIELAPERPEPYAARLVVRFQEFVPLALSGRQEMLAALANGAADARRVRTLSDGDPGVVAQYYGVEVAMRLFEHGLGAGTMAELDGLQDLDPVVLGAALADFATRATPEQRALYEDAPTLLAPALADPAWRTTARFGLLMAAIGRGELAAVVENGAALRDAVPDFGLVWEVALAMSHVKRFEGATEADVVERLGVLARTTESGVPHLFAAIELEKQGRDGLALEEYRRALTRMPEQPEAWLGLGTALVRAGRLGSEARRALERVARAAEGSSVSGVSGKNRARAEYALASVARSEGRLADVVEHLRTATSADPSVPHVQRLYGDVLEELATRDADTSSLVQAVRRAELAARLFHEARDGKQREELGYTDDVDVRAAAEACLDDADRRAARLRESGALDTTRLLRIEHSIASLRVVHHSQSGGARLQEARKANLDILEALEGAAELTASERQELAMERGMAAHAVRGSYAQAIEDAEEAVALSLGKDARILWTLSSLYEANGDPGQAAEVMREAAAVCRDIWGPESRPPLLESIERRLLDLYVDSDQIREFALLLDERAERLTAGADDFARAISVRLGIAGEQEREVLYDPEKARDLARRWIAREWEVEPRALVLLSCAEYRAGDLDASAEAFDRALATLRATDGDAARHGFFAVLSVQSRLDVDGTGGPGTWARLARERLDGEERAELDRH